MDLEDGNRPAPRFTPLEILEIVGVAPGEIRRAGDDRGGRGAHFRLEAEGVGLERLHHAVGRNDFVFVDGAGAQMRDEDLPKAAVDALAHLALASVPLVEIADDRHARRVGRPNCENDAVRALVAGELRAEAAIELLVRPLDQQMVVERPQHRAESVRVLIRVDALGARDFEPVDWPFRRPRDQALEEIVLAAPEFDDRSALARDRAHAERVGDERPDRPSLGGEVRSENGEGIFLSRRGDRVHVLFFRPPILEHVARPFKRRVGTERVFGAVSDPPIGVQPRTYASSALSSLTRLPRDFDERLRAHLRGRPTSSSGSPASPRHAHRCIACAR